MAAVQTQVALMQTTEGPYGLAASVTPQQVEMIKELNMRMGVMQTTVDHLTQTMEAFERQPKDRSEERMVRQLSALQTEMVKCREEIIKVARESDARKMHRWPKWKAECKKNWPKYERS